MSRRGSSPGTQAAAACRSDVVGPALPRVSPAAPGVRGARAQESLPSDGTVTQQWGNLRICGEGKSKTEPWWEVQAVRAGGL